VLNENIYLLILELRYIFASVITTRTVRHTIKTVKIMLVKGSADYKKAQKLAEVIEGAAQRTKRDREYYDVEFASVEKFLNEIKSLNVFASNIAETVLNTMSFQNFQVAKISNKQSWILACAAVENNIEF
jgi:hypothetical protein